MFTSLFVKIIWIVAIGTLSTSQKVGQSSEEDHKFVATCVILMSSEELSINLTSPYQFPTAEAMNSNITEQIDLITIMETKAR